LAETVSAVAGPILGLRKFAGSLAAAEWVSIVGERLAADSLPERVMPSPGDQGGTLHVRIASGAVGLELQHLEPLIVERINTYFGHRAVARLKLVHRPMPRTESDGIAVRALAAADERMIDDSVAGVDEPDLQQALRELGRRLFARLQPPDR
jgi:hypothetical protein